MNMPRRGHRVVTPTFHVSRTDEGFVYPAETIVRTLRLSGFQPQEVVCEAIPAFAPLLFKKQRSFPSGSPEAIEETSLRPCL